MIAAAMAKTQLAANARQIESKVKIQEQKGSDVWTEKATLLLETANPVHCNKKWFLSNNFKAYANFTVLLIFFFVIFILRQSLSYSDMIISTLHLPPGAHCPLSFAVPIYIMPNGDQLTGVIPKCTTEERIVKQGVGHQAEYCQRDCDNVVAT